MNPAAWFVAGLTVAWLIAAAIAAVYVGRAAARRDRQIPGRHAAQALDAAADIVPDLIQTRAVHWLADHPGDKQCVSVRAVEMVISGYLREQALIAEHGPHQPLPEENDQ